MEIGEIRKAREAGKCGTARYIWHACVTCGAERWVILIAGRAKNLHCGSCGQMRDDCRQFRKDGYILVKLRPDNFYYIMAHSRDYVMEHRLIMAHHLGRCLQPWELVHHKDGNKSNNKFSNLKLTTKGSHIIEHSKGYRDGYAKGLIDGRLKQIEELKREIRLLQWQLKEVRKEV